MPLCVRERHLPRPNWSRPRPGLTIPTIMDLVTLADVRTLLEHQPKETRVRDTWQYVRAELEKSAASGDATQVSITLQMLLELEHVEYEMT